MRRRLWNSEHSFIYRRLWPFRHRLLLSVLLVLVRSVVLVCPSLIIKHIIDTVLPSHNATGLWISAFLLVFIPVFSGVSIIIDLKVTNFMLHVFAALRTEIYDGLQNRPLSWIKRANLGDILHRLLGETEKVAIFGYQGWNGFLWSSITILTAVGFMFVLSLQLALAMLALFVLQTIMFWTFGKSMETAGRRLEEASSNLTECIREITVGANYIKSNGKVDFEMERLHEHIHAQQEAQMRNNGLGSIFKLLNMLFAGMCLAMIYGWGGMMVLHGQISPGTMIALSGIYTYVGPILLHNKMTLVAYKSTTPSIERIKEIFYPKGDAESTSYRTPNHIDIECANVQFAVEGTPILKDVNLSIPEGKKVAIVGPSGAGKSTLSDLLLGFDHPTEGIISVGGVDLREMDNHWFRANVREVSQEVQIRGGTILDNVMYGSVDQGDDKRRLNELLRIAQLDDYVSGLPNKLNTELGALGRKASGGERQRISLARALHSQPRILVLDEATSALDNTTEKRLFEKIFDYLPDTTIILITHRMNVCTMVDEVITMCNGKIVEQGPHEKLMKRKGLYYSFYRTAKSDSNELVTAN